MAVQRVWLTVDDSAIIELRRQADCSIRVIARELGSSSGTVCDEIKRLGKVAGYRQQQPWRMPRSSSATMPARLLGRKAELLRVLERPEIPLQTNGYDNDIHARVIKPKISGGT